MQVIYYTVPLPFAFLIPMVLLAVSIPGGSDGAVTYFQPNWSLLSHPDVWLSAAGQVLFSLNVASGGSVTLASYNTPNCNPFKATMVVAAANWITSMVAGFAVYSFAGHIAYELHITVSNERTRNK